MSTRANIFIRNSYNDRDKEIVYHHCDGYPDGVGRILTKILSMFPKDKLPTATKKGIAEFICDCDHDFRITTPFCAGDAEYIYEIDLSACRVDWQKVATNQEEWLCDF